jgi:O-antigen/teichoic acid export membrane protein
MPENLKGRTAHALIWSAAQSWSVKVLTLLLFMVLARYLSQAEMGVAATVMLTLAFVAIVAEQGFPEAIIQRPRLLDAELNLPFAFSVAFGTLCGIAMWVWAAPIARLLRAEMAAPYIAMAAVVPPLAAVASFQTAMRKRLIDFRTLASVTFTATVLSGTLAVGLALTGLGAASIVVQAIAAAALSAFMLWRRPVWRLTRQRDWPALRQILDYSAPAFGARLVDFFGGRLIELIVLGRYGLAGLGLYTVGAKMYQTLLQLLGSSLTDVALTSMSKIADDQPRLQQNYLRFLFLAACTTLPLFVGVAVLTPELCRLLFGERWGGVEEVAHWLCLLGAVQAVQFFNGSLLAATGRVSAVFYLNVGKATIAAVSLWFAPTENVGGLALVFLLAQLFVSPFSFFAGMRQCGASLRAVAAELLPGVVAAAVGYALVFALRPVVALQVGAPIVQLALLAGLFTSAVAIALLLICPGRLQVETRFLLSALRARRSQ